MAVDISTRNGRWGNIWRRPVSMTAPLTRHILTLNIVRAARKLYKGVLYHIQYAMRLSTHPSSRCQATLHGKISQKTHCKPFRFCTMPRLSGRFLHATPPSYTPFHSVYKLLKNAKVVLGGSPELQERIHISKSLIEARWNAPKSHNPRAFTG